MSSCLLLTLLSSDSALSSWLGSGPSRSLSWRSICVAPSASATPTNAYDHAAQPSAHPGDQPSPV